MRLLGPRWRRIATRLLASGLIACCASAMAATPAPLTLTVTNTLDLVRKHEVVSLPLTKLWQRRPEWKSHALAVRIAGHDERLPTQRYASDGGTTPDRLLVQLNMAPYATVHLQIRTAADAYAPKDNPLFARRVPERKGDFAWENEQVAFRIYGKPLEANGGLVSSGIDVWSKQPGHLVINEWYARNARGERLGDPSLSYHIDHGDGQDSYAVGHSPGDGGTAAWLHGRPVYSHNATHVHITAMGPVRLRFEVDYAPWHVGGAQVREHKVVTLDAGSHFNRQKVFYRITGARKLSVAAGLAVHPGALTKHEGASSIAVWDTPQKKSAGRIATALILPPDETAHYVKADGAVWALFKVANGDSIRFASGAGWSKGDVPDFTSWQRDVRDYRKRWSHPLRVHWPARN